MTALSLAILLATSLVADLSVEELIVRLGSPDRVVREEAGRTLVERGPDALPALRAAREAADGAEARNRLDALIDAAEAGLLGRPTAVELDVDDRPLGEAIATLAASSGYALALDDPALADRRVTVRSESPLPFWEALDRLGRAGHIRHDPGPRRDAQGNDPGAAVIRLVDGDPPGFTAYGGPLRVHLFATHRHRDLNFGGPEVGLRSPPAPEVTAEVQAFAEPGRFLDPAGPPRLEAVDDRGRPLPRAAGGGRRGAEPVRALVADPGPVVPAPVAPPARPGRPAPGPGAPAPLRPPRGRLGASPTRWSFPWPMPPARRSATPGGWP